MNKKIVLVLMALFVLQACSEDGERSKSTAQVVVTQASSIILQSIDVESHYVTSGTVTSDHRVSISSRISGYIRKLSVREGDRVKKGQVLVRVDPVNAKQSLVQAEAALANATADLKRYELLYKEHATSQQQLDKVRLRYKVARSQAAQARNQLGYAEVRSPVNGVVVEKRLSKGDLAQPGAMILTLEDPASLLVETYVSEQFVSSIHIGDTVNLEIPSIQSHLIGTVRQVVEAADAVSHQFLVKVALQADSAVHAGMYVQIGFSTGMRKAVVVPSAAVVERSGLQGVYIVDAHKIIHYRQVRTGETSANNKIEILAGLRDGDVIAWDGDPFLQTGMSLQAKK
ncbi:efflux RND transporter periplasmic adaptor subunit [Mariprofundus sp. EBB-1]|uniref:efflux RND transporter periplasmic adaptor subunit n=1 Tax=Mariprofundus sp. EBB-1 TaxID=2650971 RepID=UPI000EF1A629|nr:efflux RND transporter periplasmic adaptor subunit [Mariprofundus sp. EBB-1]RLL54726.1 efflux RND transporter periplasmic adaptor subunit [Mariprofundus sp. EBB-1]